LAAALCPDPLGELKCSPRLPSRIKSGATSKGTGREGKGREGKGGEGERAGGRGGGPCFNVLGGMDAPADTAHPPIANMPTDRTDNNTLRH